MAISTQPHLSHKRTIPPNLPLRLTLVDTASEWISGAAQQNVKKQQLVFSRKKSCLVLFLVYLFLFFWHYLFILVIDYIDKWGHNLLLKKYSALQVVSVDTVDKAVKLNDGSSHNYDQLLISTGCRFDWNSPFIHMDGLCKGSDGSLFMKPALCFHCCHVD